jgi:hypothetical protein
MYINFKCTQPYIGPTPWYCTVQSPEVEPIRIADVRGSSRRQLGPSIFFSPALLSRKWPTPEHSHLRPTTRSARANKCEGLNPIPPPIRCNGGQHGTGTLGWELRPEEGERIRVLADMTGSSSGQGTLFFEQWGSKRQPYHETAS